MPTRLSGLCLFVAVSCGVAGTPARATTYYVDSQGGTDRASGRSPDQAWQTLDRIGAAHLFPGDVVLLHRGGSWSEELRINASGRAGAPLAFGAYGAGPRPVIEGGAHGIVSERQHDIEIRDLHVRSTPESGVSVRAGKSWRLENLVIEDTGRRNDTGGISWSHGSDLTVSGSILTRITGDGFWIWRADTLRLLDNFVGVVQGGSGDNAHIQYARNFEIRRNTFSMDGRTDSGKGNILLGNSDHGVIANNTLIAGNYGIGIDSSNTIVEANHFINHDKAPWSAALNMGAGRSRNLTVRDNYFDGARVALSLFELGGQWADPPVVRANLMVTGNLFRVRQHAMAVDGPVQYSGAFIDNTIIGRSARDWNRPGGTVLKEGWHEIGTKFVNTSPAWRGGAPCQRTSADPDATAPAARGRCPQET